MYEGVAASNHPGITELNKLIIQNLRVTLSGSSVYVPVAGTDEITLYQNHVIFGRRGSGKSTLLREAQRIFEKDGDIVSSIDAEQLKDITFPDVIINVLHRVFERLLSAVESANSPKGITGFLRKLFGNKMGTPKAHEDIATIRRIVDELRQLRDNPEQYLLKREVTEEKRTTGTTRGTVHGILPAVGAEVSAGIESDHSRRLRENVEFSVEKEDLLRKNLAQFQEAASQAVETLGTALIIIIDDFYFIPREDQPKAIDYLHGLSREQISG